MPAKRTTRRSSAFPAAGLSWPPPEEMTGVASEHLRARRIAAPIAHLYTALAPNRFKDF